MKVVCWAKPQKPALINEDMNNVAVPSSSLSLVEWNGEVRNVWMKKWIFWLCQVQVPALLNPIKKLIFVEWRVNLFAVPSTSVSPAESSVEVNNEVVIVYLNQWMCWLRREAGPVYFNGYVKLLAGQARVPVHQNESEIIIMWLPRSNASLRESNMKLLLCEWNWKQAPHRVSTSSPQ